MNESPKTIAESVSSSQSDNWSLESSVSKLKELDAGLNAFIEIIDEGDAATEQTPAVEQAASGALKGVPVAVKDNICVATRATTCGSKMLSDFVPPYHATVVQRLLDEGAWLVGKTNLDEFAMGGSSETAIQGSVKNPWNTECTAGGSSGGSAAAVAAAMVPASLGSDTGGSIRQPASFCGVCGIKPTYGRVSRFGLVAFASSLDQIGPFAHTVEDCATMLDVICGHDPRDTTSLKPEHLKSAPSNFAENLDRELNGLRVAVVKEQLEHESLDPEVRATIESAIDVFKSSGATITEVELPTQRYAVPAYYVIATSEASSNLARYDGAHYGYRAERSSSDEMLGDSALFDMYCRSRSEGFGDEVQRRILLGTYALSAGYIDAYYLQACKVRRLIRDELDQLFEQHDVILGPVAPTAAYRLGESIGDPLKMYLADLYTVSANLAGIPAMSVPAGFTSSGLPVGLHIQSAALREDLVLRAAAGYHHAISYAPKSPSLG